METLERTNRTSPGPKLPYTKDQIESIIIEELATWPGLPRSMYWSRLQTRIKSKGWPKILDAMIADGRVYLTPRIVGGRVVSVLNVHPEYVPTYPAHYNSPPSRSPASAVDDPSSTSLPPIDDDDPASDGPVDVHYE